MNESINSFDIFYQYCLAKPEKACEFINDYILYKLDVSIPFDDEKYLEVQKYILDFMVAFDEILKFFYCLISIPKENLSFENFNKLIEDEFHLENVDLSNFFFNIFLSNINNFLMLKNKKIFGFIDNEIKNYKINIQMDFGHSSFNDEENNFKVLLKFDKNKEENNENYLNDDKKFNNIFEIDEKNLDSFIIQLKDIYGQIKG